MLLLDTTLIRLQDVVALCVICSVSLEGAGSVLPINAHHWNLVWAVRCRTVQHAYCNKDLVFAATPPPY
jgi:hypothetical protein